MTWLRHAELSAGMVFLANQHMLKSSANPAQVKPDVGLTWA